MRKINEQLERFQKLKEASKVSVTYGLRAFPMGFQTLDALTPSLAAPFDMPFVEEEDEANIASAGVPLERRKK